jgi:FAD/FMN-containing dehydrogenase
LREIVGATQVLTEPADMAPFVTDWRGRYRGRRAAWCCPAHRRGGCRGQGLRAAGVPIVPQGGNTGLCGAATPDAAGQAVVVSLGRLNRDPGVDAGNNTITVEAGCTLAAVQEAAARPTGCFRWPWPAKAVARSAATCPPMPAACRCCATATPAS